MIAYFMLGFIGADGFGFAPTTERESILRYIQNGNVIVGNRVEIGANSTN